MNYWWIIAKDTTFDWVKDQKVGKIERWDALDKNLNHRANTLQLKQGDGVIGYNSGKIRAVVAVGIIERALYNDKNGTPSFDILKTKDLQIAIRIEEIKMISPFDKKFKHNTALKTTIIQLDENEYNLILALGNRIFSDTGDNFENIIDVLNADDSLTTVERKKCPEPTSSTSIIYPRNPAYAKESLRNTEYRCELEDAENQHTTFNSQITGKNYVEAHHLVPMKVQYKYAPETRLDVPGNIIVLCPNCHKLLHLGVSGTRIAKVTELYKKRKNILEQWGISITLEDLIEIYR